MALRPEDHLGEFHVTKARNLYVAMHNYELDSLCYHINLVYKWWKVTGRTEMFTNEWLELAHLILSLWIVEQVQFIDACFIEFTSSQNHFLLSPYRYLELAYDQGLWNTPVGYTGP
jgi:meiotically up-regulated gene 157 (Mug157) protein